jgi:hypothetical protein
MKKKPLEKYRAAFFVYKRLQPADYGIRATVSRSF